MGLEGDEIVIVTGTNIRGVDMGSLLPISVLGADEIELFGVNSGEELLDMLPEQGQNFFNEADNISGGVNSARGDVGAYNLRNVGTGNTLVLLNGRRMVNAAGFQTEEVGGSFVPVNSANSNVVPTFGLDRLEILKDGASAIYGADAVAGVVNNVLETDFQGFRLRARYGLYEHIDRSPAHLDAAWGTTFNEGRTSLSVHGTFFARNRVNAQEDPRWADADFRYRVPEGSPWEGNSNFRNNSANSLYGQFDLVASATSTGLRDVYTDRLGEFEVFPVGDARCQWDLNEHVCGAIDGQGTERYNLNADRDISRRAHALHRARLPQPCSRHRRQPHRELHRGDVLRLGQQHPAPSFGAVLLRETTRGAAELLQPLRPSRFAKPPAGFARGRPGRRPGNRNRQLSLRRGSAHRGRRRQLLSAAARAARRRPNGSGKALCSTPRPSAATSPAIASPTISWWRHWRIRPRPPTTHSAAAWTAIWSAP